MLLCRYAGLSLSQQLGGAIEGRCVPQLSGCPRLLYDQKAILFVNGRSDSVAAVAEGTGANGDMGKESWGDRER